jgi:hypothetical protein
VSGGPSHWDKAEFPAALYVMRTRRSFSRSPRLYGVEPAPHQRLAADYLSMILKGSKPECVHGRRADGSRHARPVQALCPVVGVRALSGFVCWRHQPEPGFCPAIAASAKFDCPDNTHFPAPQDRSSLRHRPPPGWRRGWTPKLVRPRARK